MPWWRCLPRQRLRLVTVSRPTRRRKSPIGRSTLASASRPCLSRRHHLGGQAGGKQRPKKKRPLHEQVARRFWIKRSCPRCRSGKGKDCINVDQTRTGQAHPIPHDERLWPIVEERKEKARKARQHKQAPQRPVSGHAPNVLCPDCGAMPGVRCATSRGPHRSRVERAREVTRKLNGN
ncbi:zinc finger domain-containing protein [Streptomyces sirii]|uniref:zinc finger domain-containing protein n=1 Tax=Streptomyces sirii TaxID=3127701 RepID=UPI003D36FCA1